jgi:hypothetical protein
VQKRRIVLVSLMVTIVIIATVSYEFFEANSLSGYTKITLNPYANPPCSVKFGNTSYYIIFFLIGKSVDGMPSMNTPPYPFFQVTIEQTLILNLNESFRANPGAKYSFEGLQIVVSNVTRLTMLVGDENIPSYTYQLTLYVKSNISGSQPIISPNATPTTSPTPTTNQEEPIPVPTPPYIVK